MLSLLAFVVYAALFHSVSAFRKHDASKEVVNGAILSAQFECKAPCASNWYLMISRTDYTTGTYYPLQVLTPPADVSLRSFETYTAFDSATRTFIVVAADYPEAGGATFWTSTVSDDISSVTPVDQDVYINYPASSSPYPLNVAPLKLSRIQHLGNNRVLCVFTNGEIHTVDIPNKSLQIRARLNTDEQLLSAAYPHATWSHVFDKETNAMWSVVTAGTPAYLVKTDIESFKVSDRIEMALPKSLIFDINHQDSFSPETFINAHMVKVNSTAPAQLMVALESLDNIGFDEITFLDTKTGNMGGAYCGDNLMEESVLLVCDSSVKQCDKWQVSAYDPEYNRIYFQGHSGDVKDPLLYLFYMQFEYAKVSGIFEVMMYQAAVLSYGYTGFQFVPLVNGKGK